jgi:hypothetical protein
VFDWERTEAGLVYVYMRNLFLSYCTVFLWAIMNTPGGREYKLSRF